MVNGLSALGGLIKADNLLGVLQAFVPVIKNSRNNLCTLWRCCEAQAESDEAFTVDLQEDMQVTTMAVRSGETIRITGKALHILEP